MSFANALPWWVYAVEYEQHLAMCACAFRDEWFSGTSKELPDYVIKIVVDSYGD